MSSEMHPPEAAASSGEFLRVGRRCPAGSGLAWIVAAWRLFMRDPWIWIANGVLLIVLGMVCGKIPYFGQVVGTLAGLVAVGGLMRGCRAQDDGARLSLGHLLAAVGDKTPPLLVLGAIYVAALLVLQGIMVLLLGGVVVSGGIAAAYSAGASLVTVIVGLLIGLAVTLPLYMAGWFALPLIVLHDLPALDALRSSFVACLANLAAFTVYGLVLSVLTVLAMIPFGLGLLVLLPVVIASAYTAYREIFFAGPRPSA